MCAIFGVYNHEEASRLTYLGLYALQHRGQESSGIVSSLNGKHLSHKGLGLVGDVFKEEVLAKLQGQMSIGHNRYSTTGENSLSNAQPVLADLITGPVAVAHNGNIVNQAQLRQDLKNKGAIFQGSSDTEIILHGLSREAAQNASPDNHTMYLSSLQKVASQLVGAYSLVIMNQSRIYALRDPMGFRPLVMGTKLNEKGELAYFFSSESCAFDLLGVKLEREIEPGELVWVDEAGLHTQKNFLHAEKLAKCVFEHVYFARPDSVVFGLSAYETRKRLGERLAQETAVEADLVIPVPDSGVPAALGYSRFSSIPFEFGIIRNHYVGRTFIQPSQNIRNFGVKIKLNPQSEILKGKRVIVVDDSLVRGTTSQKIVGLIRAAGAKEVHMRIASPPTTGPCYYGIDTPSKESLIAANKGVQEIAEFIGADSLGYLSIQGLRKVMFEKENKTDFCAACFDGHYPTSLS